MNISDYWNYDEIMNRTTQFNQLLEEYKTVNPDNVSEFCRFYIKFAPIYEFAMPMLETSRKLEQVGACLESTAISSNDPFRVPEVNKKIVNAAMLLSTRVNAFADQLEVFGQKHRTYTPQKSHSQTAPKDKKTTTPPKEEPGISFMKKGGWFNQ